MLDVCSNLVMFYVSFQQILHSVEERRWRDTETCSQKLAGCEQTLSISDQNQI